MVDRTSAGDTFVKAWKSFDRVGAGERIGTRSDGTAVLAPFAGVVVFPNADAQVGSEWFYLARESDRCGDVDSGRNAASQSGGTRSRA